MSQQDDGDGGVSSVMDRLHPAEYMQLLLHQHQAEDAFEPEPEEPADDA